MAILGQNLLYFTRNINVSVATLSLCFMAGSVGMIAGGFLTPCFKKKYPRRQFYFMGKAICFWSILYGSPESPHLLAVWVLPDAVSCVFRLLCSSSRNSRFCYSVDKNVLGFPSWIYRWRNRLRNTRNR